ncbi:MAG TPA: hypothetical protein V6C72_02115 [Chroococcales cyanobacterium]
MYGGNTGRVPKKKQPVHGSLNDLLYLHKAGAPTTVDAISSLNNDELDPKTFATLLNKNFARLDPSGRGLTEEALSKLIMKPDQFAQDEYAMLVLLAKYFSTIANMCQDQPGKQTVITHMDKDVLCQFLLYGNMSLAELHRWCVLSATPVDEAGPPPPLSTG